MSISRISSREEYNFFRCVGCGGCYFTARLEQVAVHSYVLYRSCCGCGQVHKTFFRPYHKQKIVDKPVIRDERWVK